MYLTFEEGCESQQSLNGVDSTYWLFQDFEGKQGVGGHGSQNYW